MVMELVSLDLELLRKVLQKKVLRPRRPRVSKDPPSCQLPPTSARLHQKVVAWKQTQKHDPIRANLQSPKAGECRRGYVGVNGDRPRPKVPDSARKHQSRHQGRRSPGRASIWQRAHGTCLDRPSSDRTGHGESRTRRSWREAARGAHSAEYSGLRRLRDPE
jgi:hypothetical protein